MRLRMFVSAFTVIATGAGLAVPVPATAAELLSATDDRADVRIFHSVDGLSKRARKSIDISTLRVADGSDKKIRFTFRIKEIIRRPKFEQMFFVDMTPPAGSDGEWSAGLGFTSKGGYSYAYYYDPAANIDVWCEFYKGVSVKPAKEKASVDVPRRCVPDLPAKVRATTFTGQWRSDEDPWSRDRLRVTGVYDLKP